MAALATVAISKCVGATTTGTYTYTNTTGTLIAGVPIIIAGFVAHTTFNGNFVVLTVVNTLGILTFTTAIPSTTATETISATGIVDPEGVSVYPSDVVGGLGYGYTKRLLYTTLDPYGNFIPGTLAGTGQYIEV